jgi:hypothetical protein
MAPRLDCWRLAFALALPLAGCVFAQVRSMPVGRSVASKPPDCPVREERLTPREAQDRYQQVGVICYFGWGVFTSTEPRQTASDDVFRTPPVPRKPPPSSPDQSARASDTLVADVRDEVCQLGGEIVVRQSFCRVSQRLDGVELGVYATTPPALSRGPATSDGAPSP